VLRQVELSELLLPFACQYQQLSISLYPGAGRWQCDDVTKRLDFCDIAGRALLLLFVGSVELVRVDSVAKTVNNMDTAAEAVYVSSSRIYANSICQCSDTEVSRCS
jgi:hypothetical protein